MKDTSDILFEFLGDLFYRPADAKLDVDSLDEDYKKVGQALVFFAQKLTEQRAFASSLARGELSEEIPSADNELAAPLKALHANLRHLTWQTQQVAKGDYRQRVDFMGEFSDAFNSMIRQLQSRQHELEAEIELSRSKTLALEQSNSLLTDITAGLPQCIFVVSKSTGDVLYQNNAAINMGAGCPLLQTKLQDLALHAPASLPDGFCEEFTLEQGKRQFVFSSTSYSMQWQGHDAKAFIVNDVSAERALVKELEQYAYQDELTGLFNRHAGMQVLQNWLAENKAFSLCFADLDNLKYVNDTFGHSEGDTYLTNAAHQLEAASANFVVSRIGGDEFMVLMPGYTEEQATAAMHTARQALADISSNQYNSSISFGVVQVGENDKRTSSEILALADELMYQHKRKNKQAQQKKFLGQK